MSKLDINYCEKCTAGLSFQQGIRFAEATMRAAAVVALLLLLPTPVRAEVSQSELKACSAKSNPQERLACFDALGGVKPAMPSVGLPRVTVPQVMADLSDLIGKKVVVSGFVLMMGQQALLYSSMGEMTALFVEIDRLPRDQRMVLFEKCGSGCSAEFTGKVSKIMMQPGLKAESFILD